jgi:hypothetical protein
MNGATSSLRPSGVLFCAGLSWWLYIIGMCPRVPLLIFESGYKKLASYTIDDRTENMSRQLARTLDPQIGRLP